MMCAKIQRFKEFLVGLLTVWSCLVRVQSQSTSGGVIITDRITTDEMTTDAATSFNEASTSKQPTISQTTAPAEATTVAADITTQTQTTPGRLTTLAEPTTVEQFTTAEVSTESAQTSKDLTTRALNETTVATTETTTDDTTVATIEATTRSTVNTQTPPSGVNIMTEPSTAEQPTTGEANTELYQTTIDVTAQTQTTPARITTLAEPGTPDQFTTAQGIEATSEPAWATVEVTSTSAAVSTFFGTTPTNKMSTTKLETVEQTSTTVVGDETSTLAFLTLPASPTTPARTVTGASRAETTTNTDNTAMAATSREKGVSTSAQFSTVVLSTEVEISPAAETATAGVPGSTPGQTAGSKVSVTSRDDTTTVLTATIEQNTLVQATAIGVTTPAEITNKAGTTKLTSLTTTTAVCPKEVLVVAGKTLTFLETRIGLSRDSVEKCASHTNQGGLALASRWCVGGSSGAHWQDPVINNCAKYVNDQLNELKNTTVTTDNVDDVAQTLVNITGDAFAIDGKAVSSTADILDNIVNIRNPSPELTADVVNVVNNLLQADDENLNEASHSNSSSRIVRALENQISYVLADGGNFTGVTSSLAVKAQNIPPTSLVDGVGFAATKGEDKSDPLTEERIGVYYSDFLIPEDQVEASVELPKEILTGLPSASGSVPITFILYQNSKLFRSKSTRLNSRLYIGSSIISATVVNVSIDKLPADAPVATNFLQNQRTQENQSVEETIKCVFWDFRLEDGIGDWSTEGCRRATSGRGRALCHCDHATSFAVLVNIHGQKVSSLALDIISKIGCGVSIVALALTIIIYLAIESLRERPAGRILISFSLSLLCLYVVFLAGVEQTSSRVGCIVVAVLLHYFALTSVAWMGVEAVNLYLKLVKVFHANVPHFMIKASAVAWGLPLVVIGVILGLDYTEYENKTSCFLKPGSVFYYSQLLIIGLVLLLNTIIFVLVFVKLTCKTGKIADSAERSERSQAWGRLQNMAAISVLLGLTWVFGLLSVIESSNFIFQILFCVSNSLQGLFIFLLFVVRQEKIRSYLGGKRGAYRLDISTSKSGLLFDTRKKPSLQSYSDVQLVQGETSATEQLEMVTFAEQEVAAKEEMDGGFRREKLTSFSTSSSTERKNSANKADEASTSL